jgi:hypothetical protein
VELAAWRESDAELEALWTSSARVRDLVLGSADGPSSLVVSMSVAAELLEGRINAAAASGVRWGSCSTLVAVVSHFSELMAELEVLGSRRNADLTEDKQMPSEPECTQPWICWCHMFLLRMPITSLTARGSSGGSLCR